MTAGAAFPDQKREKGCMSLPDWLDPKTGLLWLGIKIQMKLKYNCDPPKSIFQTKDGFRDSVGKGCLIIDLRKL